MFELIRRPSLSLSPFMDDFDRIFNDMLEPVRSVNRQLGLPSVDMYTKGDGNKLVLELPASGFTPEEIDIHADGNALDIRGERSEKTEEGKRGKRDYMLRENAVSFYRRISLPEGANTEQISAELEHGMLKVTIPVEHRETKRIAIAAPKSNGKERLTATAKARTSTGEAES